jgi:hypothetical protein
MPDVVIAGEAPPADISPFPSGTMWMTVTAIGSRNAKTVNVDIWVKDGPMPTYLGYNLGGPTYDMQGGPFIATSRPNAWTTAPTPTVPGKVTVAGIAITDDNFYHFEAQAGGVGIHCDCQIGVPGVKQMGPDYDGEAIFRNTMAGRMAQEKLNILDMQRPTGIIGRPNPRGTKMPRRVP